MTMRGVQVSLVVIIVLALLSVTIGVFFGALSGYFGGWLDAILMRLTDVILVIPLLVVVSVAAFSFRGVRTCGASRSCSGCSRGPVSPDWCEPRC